MFRWLLDWWRKPIVRGRDFTDDELPPEAHRTWGNLADAYGFDDEED